MMFIMQQHFYPILEYIRAGGIVMIPLVIVSVVMWVLIIQKVFFFRHLYRKTISRNQAGEFVRKNIVPGSGTCEGITALFVTEFLRRRRHDSKTDTFILDETVISLVSLLDKYLAIIGVLAGIAPLLGLLGTVIGMMATFDIISTFGTGNARAMAGGISEALITTQTGLLIAIPGIYMKNFLNRRSEVLKHEIAGLGIYLKRYV